MEKINIAELLKDCPQGMELECTMLGGLEFDYINEEGISAPICCRLKDSDGRYKTYNFTKYGCWYNLEYAKCVIFPKGKTTWEGFTPPCKFKDGDIIYVKSKSILNTELVGIYKKEDSELIYDYCSVSLNSKSFYHDNMGLINKNIIDISRLATEEEKQKLFQAIKDNGYHWNEKTKTLEKLAESKFKVGDEIVKRNSISNSWIVSSVSSEYYGLKLPNGIEGIGVLPVSEQDDWELLSNIRPKFKVGDVIQDKDGYKVKITEVNLEDECYGYESIIAKGIGGIAFNEQNNWKLVPNIEPKFKVGDKIVRKDGICVPILITGVGDAYYWFTTENSTEVLPIADQDDWELVPTKFDINTLKPFESKVLVRNYDSDYWKPAIFGFTEKDRNDPFYVVGGNFFNECIPYKGNEHLLSTREDCNNFYKTWEL